ncbi:MAG TPA: hypothetical protein VND93_19185, partial [Myxococcales bacterium]|nr:hypothetical protein [Myxococcales bacterium]
MKEPVAWAVAALVVAALLPRLVRTGELPARLCSRPAGRLVPGPFPPSQTAAERLDLVTNDRLIAMRELRGR